MCTKCASSDGWGAVLVAVDLVVLGALFAGFVFLPHGVLAALVHALVLVQVWMRVVCEWAEGVPDSGGAAELGCLAWNVVISDTTNFLVTILACTFLSHLSAADSGGGSNPGPVANAAGAAYDLPCAGHIPGRGGGRRRVRGWWKDVCCRLQRRASPGMGIRARACVCLLG